MTLGFVAASAVKFPDLVADLTSAGAYLRERLGAEATRLKMQAAALPTRQRDLEVLDDAIAEAEALIGPYGAEVVMFERAGLPIHSIYSVTPNTPVQGELLPFSYPGLERSKLPTFLYLWQPDPTLVKTPTH